MENGNITPGQETNWKSVFILSHQIPYYICMGSSMMNDVIGSIPKVKLNHCGAAIYFYLKRI